MILQTQENNKPMGLILKPKWIINLRELIKHPSNKIIHSQYVPLY